MARRNGKGQFVKGGSKSYGKRSRRSFRGFGALPGMEDLKKTAGGYDVLMGVVVGLAGAAAGKWLLNKANENGWMVIDTTGLVYQGAPLIGAALAGVLAQKYGSSEAKGGHLIGAVASGLAIVGFEQVLPRVAPSLFGYGLRPQLPAPAYAGNYAGNAATTDLAQMALEDGIDGGDAAAIDSLLQ